MGNFNIISCFYNIKIDLFLHILIFQFVNFSIFNGPQNKPNKNFFFLSCFSIECFFRFAKWCRQNNILSSSHKWRHALLVAIWEWAENQALFFEKLLKVPILSWSNKTSGNFITDFPIYFPIEFINYYSKLSSIKCRKYGNSNQHYKFMPIPSFREICWETSKKYNSAENSLDIFC